MIVTRGLGGSQLITQGYGSGLVEFTELVSIKTGVSKRRGGKIYEPIEPIIPETQEIPVFFKRKPRVVKVSKYDMTEVNKVISEGWKPKGKYQESLSQKDLSFLDKTVVRQKAKSMPQIDLHAEQMKQARIKRIKIQNSMIIMLGMEED